MDHVNACNSAKYPWSSTTNPSLIIASSELSSEWTGWLEGAIISGINASEQMKNYLFPSKIERNLMRRI